MHKSFKMEDSKKCSSNEHKDIPAKIYCVECKIYMCENCENMHSKLFKSHQQYNIDNNLTEIFTGFCTEKNHSEKLEFYCKTHNKLICSSCIIKVQTKDKGQHMNCNVCSIEDIKNEKKNLLNENITKIDDILNNIKSTIEELKTIYNKLNEKKENLKLDIKEIFNKIKDEINKREKELLLEIDKIYEQNYINENIIKEINELPNKLSISKKNCENEKEWNDENKLSYYINESINIENYISKVNNTNKILEKYKNEFNINDIKFEPYKEDDINNILSKIEDLGKIYKYDNANENEEDRQINIEIKSAENINYTLLELFGIDLEKYNKLFLKPITGEENEIILTIFLEIKNSDNLKQLTDELKDFSIGSFFDMPELDSMVKSSTRIENNKLLLDYILNIKDFEFIKYFYQFDYDFNNIYIKLQNFCDISKFANLKELDFLLLILSNIISISYNTKNIKKTLDSIIDIIRENERRRNIRIAFSYMKFARILGIIKSIKSFKLNFSSKYLLESIRYIRTNLYEKTNKQLKADVLESLKPLITDMKNDIGELFNSLKFDNIELAFLFVKYKTGFNIKINTSSFIK